MQCILALDVGGTMIRAALVEREGHIVRRHAIPTLAHRGKDVVMERVMGAIERVAPPSGRERLVGVGVALASPTDPRTGVMHNPPNLPGWDGFSLKPVLEARLSLRTFCANDATLAALAEHRYGAGRPFRHMIYITLSTGVGGGVIIDGRLYTGARGFAGEIGHVTVDPNGPACNCGNRGCLETMCSGTAVARMAREGLESGEGSGLLRYANGDPARVDARAVEKAARSGDGLALNIIARAGTHLGTAIAGLLHSFDPEAIVIGGSMRHALDLMLPSIEAELAARAMAHERGRMPVIRSELGDDSGLIGAAALAFERCAPS